MVANKVEGGDMPERGNDGKIRRGDDREKFEGGYDGEVKRRQIAGGGGYREEI